jgi:hypothetical protein
MANELLATFPCTIVWYVVAQSAEILRYKPEGHGFSSEWTTRPEFHLWPPQRHNATAWTLAHLVRYITNEHRLSLTDYIDFLRHARWKAYKMPRRMRTVGNYLEIL